MLFGGTNMVAAQLAIVCFSLLGAASAFYLLRDRLGPWVALAAVLCLFSLPQFIKYQNVLMLELPAITMGLLTLLLYQKLLVAGSVPWWRYSLFAVVGVASIYTKQTQFVVTSFVKPYSKYHTYEHGKNIKYICTIFSNS